MTMGNKSKKNTEKPTIIPTVTLTELDLQALLQKYTF